MVHLSSPCSCGLCERTSKKSLHLLGLLLPREKSLGKLAKSAYLWLPQTLRRSAFKQGRPWWAKEAELSCKLLRISQGHSVLQKVGFPRPSCVYQKDCSRLPPELASALSRLQLICFKHACLMACHHQSLSPCLQILHICPAQ